MQRGVFITGSDTGVGKTRIGTALASWLSARGLRVAVRKPVESGCPDGPQGPLPQDADALRLAAGGWEDLDAVCRVRLRAALSPERAAALEGVRLELDALVQHCRAGVDAADFLIVEGAGGFYSPLAQHALNADLAVRLRLPVLLVAADRLGTINHSLLTAEAVRGRGLALAGVVLSQPSPQPDVSMDNAGELARWLGMSVQLLRHGPASGADAGPGDAAALAPLFEQLLDGARPTRSASAARV